MSKRSDAVTEAMSRTIVQQPFFAVLLTELLELRETDEVPTAATDGFKLYINPTWFAKLKTDERVFVLAHEALHVVFDHPGRMKLYAGRGIGPDLKAFNVKKYNVAADYVINDSLVTSGLKSMPQGGLLNPQFDHTMLVDEVYLQLTDEDAEEGEGNWDVHMPAGDGDAEGKDVDGTGSHAEATVQRALKSAKAAAKAAGSFADSLERLVDAFCEPQIVWTEQLALNVAHSAGRDSSTWARPNRRRMALPPHIYMPGTTGFSAGTIAMYGDTSGSIDDEVWAYFFAEFAAIVEQARPQACFIGSCDTEATEPLLVGSADEVFAYKPVGGGGTNMPAIVDKLEEHDVRPDVLVILTDGYTPFGSEPPYDVIWCMTTDVVAPYGTTLRIRA